MRQIKSGAYFVGIYSPALSVELYSPQAQKETHDGEHTGI